MWSDDSNSQDFINFGIFAKVIASVIKKNGIRPLSIGISGAWGVGKSTTLELLAKELEAQKPEPIIVRFHPWRHQSQDNIRAAFAECISKAILKNQNLPTKVVEKARSIVKRANIIRIAGYGLGGALTLATGIPIGKFISDGIDSISGLMDGDITPTDRDKATSFSQAAVDKLTDIVSPSEKAASPYENIEKICEEFAEILETINKQLIVLIDDLDRCLPTTTIEALEAMRLYFFVPRTTFVIAADEDMLRLAVRKHFEVSDQTLDDGYLQSYYDKLIQLPFRIPSLTVPDAIVYMTLLVLEQQSGVNQDVAESIRKDLCALLAKTWDGTRVNRESIMRVVGKVPVDNSFETRISMVERLAPIMVTSKKIGGNPRLIKRFMNSLSVLESLANETKFSPGMSEDVLAKVLLLQRCGDQEQLNSLQRDVLQSVDGKSSILKHLECSIDSSSGNNEEELSSSGNCNEELVATTPETTKHWQTRFSRDWLKMEPRLSEVDLRPVFHVSRGAEAAFAFLNQLSRQSQELIEVIKKNPKIVQQLEDRIRAIAADEVPTVMNHLINHMRTVPSQEFNDYLRCCVLFETCHETQSTLLVSLLKTIDSALLNAASVAIFARRPWASNLCDHLESQFGEKSPTVKVLRKALEK